MKALLIVGFALGVTTTPPTDATLTLTLDSETDTHLTSSHCTEDNLAQTASFTLTTDSMTPTLTENDKLYVWGETSGALLFATGWRPSFCPRHKTQQGYTSLGPFKNEADMHLAIKRQGSDYETLTSRSNSTTTSY